MGLFSPIFFPTKPSKLLLSICLCFFVRALKPPRYNYKFFSDQPKPDRAHLVGYNAERDNLISLKQTVEPLGQSF